MNEVFNTFFLVGDKFMAELDLRQLGLTYSSRVPFAKDRERIYKFKEAGDLNYIHENEEEKVCFANDAAYANRKGLAKKTLSDNIVKHKSCEIALNPQYDRYQRGLASMVHKSFDQKIG